MKFLWPFRGVEPAAKRFNGAVGLVMRRDRQPVESDARVKSEDDLASAVDERTTIRGSSAAKCPQ